MMIIKSKSTMSAAYYRHSFWLALKKKSKQKAVNTSIFCTSAQFYRCQNTHSNPPATATNPDTFGYSTIIQNKRELSF